MNSEIELGAATSLCQNHILSSVKSAYKLHTSLLLQQGSSIGCSSDDNREWRQKVWKQIWKLECPPKVQHFLWRFGHNSHPLHMNIARRGVELDTRCVVCNRLFEDGGHLFLRCKEVKACWRVLKLDDVRVQLCACPSPLELLEHMFTLPADTKMMVVALLWCWWRERNKVNHQERRLSAEEFRSLILYHTGEWNDNLSKRSQISSRPVPRWTPPPVDMIKINIDGSFLTNLNTGGWGAIGRDHLGEPVFAACGRVPVVAEALQTELMALIQAIPVAEQLGISRVIFCTDCSELKKAIETNSYDMSRLGPLFMQAKYLMRLAFSDYSVEYCPRACNSPAHKLAALGGVWNQGSPGLWIHDIPPDVMNSVANESVGP